MTRDLYRAWDAHPLTFGGHAIDAHFVHPPPSGMLPGAVWCEAAVDGLVWFDPFDRMAAELAGVRRAIAHGRVIRAMAHGQPYWKEGA